MLNIRDNITTIILATYVPVFNALCGFDFSSPLTKNVPIIADIIPTAERIRGKTAPARADFEPATPITPKVMAETIEPTYDSKRSAPIPATSPTLSPTLSAITAGFLGSSSGIPASTFPTRSAPTSAAFVYIPPPTRPKSAIDEAPRLKPERTLTLFVMIYTALTPKSPKPTTDIPITAPPENAIDKALFIPLVLAAFAVLTLAFVATFIPKYPAKVENIAPTIKHTAVITLIPIAISINKTMANIISILYSAVRKAFAPSRIEPAISFILSVPSSIFPTFEASTKAKSRAIIPITGAT